jgi:RNA polymerase sigma-70 factor, ECF subfamily
MTFEPPQPYAMSDETIRSGSDAELLAAHVAGDAHAFGELVRRHRDRLWAVALRTTGDPEEAADALQDGLIGAFRNAASFRGEAAVTTWLHRVVVNASLDRLRRQKVRPTIALPDESEDSGYRGIADSRDRINEFELRHEIEKALAELPNDQRIAIILVDVEGMSVAEAAEILDIPEGTVKSRCSRGRTRLAQSLAGLRNPDAVPDVTVTRPPEIPRGNNAHAAVNATSDDRTTHVQPSLQPREVPDE